MRGAKFNEGDARFLLGGHHLGGLGGHHHHLGGGGHDAGGLALLDLASKAARGAGTAANHGGAAIDSLGDAEGPGSLQNREKKRWGRRGRRGRRTT